MAAQAGLSLTWSKTPKTFSRDEAQLYVREDKLSSEAAMLQWIGHCPCEPGIAGFS